MITELSAQNFKSWQDTRRLRFAPLTGFFGANNSGKTSILQVLLMLKQTTEVQSDLNEPLHFVSGQVSRFQYRYPRTQTGFKSRLCLHCVSY